MRHVHRLRKYIMWYKISVLLVLLVQELVDMASKNFDDGGDFSWDSSLYALMDTQQFLEENPNLVEFDENPLIDSYVPQKALFICGVCQRTYKTK